MATNSEEIIRSVEEPQADDTQQLYNNLKEDGYEDIGTLDEFRANVANREMSDQLYNNLKEDGYEDLGTSDEFFSRLNPAPLSETPDDTKEQTMPNVTGEQTTQQQPAIPTIDPELEASAKLGGVIEKAKDAPAPDTVPGTQEWRNRTVNIPGENPYNGQTYGAVYDSIIQDFGKNMTHPDVDPYAEARAKIMQAGITDDLKPEDADKLALNIREGYANRYAEGEAKNIVSALPDQVPNIDQLMDGLWYTRDLQNSITHEAQRLGLRQENYVNYYVKPQIAKALSDRYGYDVESAKHIAARLLSQEGHTMERVRQNEAAEMVGRYAEPKIQAYFDRALLGADQKFREEAEGGMMTPYGNAGQMLGASIRHYQNTDPAKVWDMIKPEIDQMSKDIIDTDFILEAEKHAEEEGVDINSWLEARVIPMMQSQIQAKFEQMAIEREMPKNTMDYIWANIQQSLVGTIARAALESQARRRMKAEALQRTEAGQGAYNPGFGAKIAGGAAAMLPDMLLPYGGPFGLTAKFATKPVQGMTQTLIADGMRPLLARMTQSSVSGGLSLGAFEGLKGGVEGALNPTDQDSYLSDNRSAADILADTAKGIFEKGVPSGFSGLAMVGGPLGQKISNGRGVLANALGWGTQVGVDAAGATALSTIPKIIQGDVDWKEVGKDFASNVGTFAALGLHGKGKEFASLAKGGKAWNGVEFTQKDIDLLEDRYLQPLRKFITETEEAQKKRGLIGRSSLGINADQEMRDAIDSAGTMMYNDIMRSYAVPRELKVKVAQALGMPVPEYAMKPDVVELEKQATAKGIEMGWIDAMNYDYNKPGGVADKVRNGEPLTDSELTLRLIFQDNQAFNDALMKQQSGEPLTEQEQELIATNQNRLNQIYREYSKEESGRLAHLFEEEYGMAPGSLTRMMKDAAEGKAVDSNLLNEYEEMLRDYNAQLDDARAIQEAEAAKEAEETAEVEQPAEEATVEEAPKVNRAVDNAEGETPVGRTDGESTPAAPPVNQTTGKVMEVELVDGRKAYVVDGDPNNPEGLISLVDENGQPVRMTRNGYTFDRFSPEIIQKDEKGYPKVTETKDLPNKEENAENETVVSSGDLVSKEEAPEATAMSKIKVADDGTELWEESPVEDTIAALRERVGNEETRQMVDEQIEDISAELNDLTKAQKGKNKQRMSMGDRIKKREAIADAKKRLDYWNQVKEVLDNEQADSKGQEMDSQHTDRPAGSESEGGEGQIQVGSPAEGAAEDLSVQGKPSGENDKAGTSVSDNNVSGGAPAEEKPIEPTAEQKIALGTVRNNIDKRFSFQNQDGTRSEVTVDLLNGDKVSVTRQDYDLNGNPKGEPYKQDLNLIDVGNSIVNGTLAPVLSTEEKLRNAYKGKIGMQNVIDVLTDEERQRMLDAVERKDQDALNEMTNEFLETHKEDMILNERDKRNDAVSRIMEGGGSREDKLRRVRKEFQGYDDAVLMLSDEAIQPTTLEEYVADLHSRQPKAGEGPLAYFSYDKDGKKVVGMQDETGHGTKSGGDTKGYAPWLAPKGKGMSLQQYAETIHSQLPEAVQQQYSDQDVRNAIIEVFGSAERPSDITTMVIRRGIIQAEQAARRMEEMWIDGAPDFHRVSPNDNSFTGRLERAKQQTNSEPSEAQKEAGNYRKGHVSFGGYDFVVENPEGSFRRGKDADGKSWENRMNNTYGYILGKRGKDGDHLDMFINDAADLDNWNGKVYVVDQVDPKTGMFDEHKIMYGFDSEAEARDAYLSNYSKGWKGLGKITGVDKDTFDKWLDSSDKKIKEFAEHSIIRDATNKEEQEEAHEVTAQEIEKAFVTKLGDVLKESAVPYSDDVNEGQKIIDDYNKRASGGEETSDMVRPQKVTDEKELEDLNNGPTVKRYRAMQLIDGKLYPPMSAKVNGEMREPTEIGVWEKAEERPDLVKNGKFVLNKGQKGQGNVPAAYNPYFHTSTSGLNNQFTSAYKRPELVVVEVEIPESELTNGYKAEGAKDAVGNVDWHSGVVNGQLPADRQRQVTLSRYSKVNRIVPDSEVADMIAKQLDGTDIEVPYNVVTPAQRTELEKRGVKISSKPAGSVTEDINGNPIRQQKRIDSLSEAETFIEESLKGNKQNKSFEISLPESTQKMVRREMGRDYDSHNISANSMVHSKKNHGENGKKITENSIPLRDEDFKLAPHIMVAPDRISKGSMDPSGRESIRFEKNLSNGVVLVVEKEQKNSPDDMDTITMWAEKSIGGADARRNTSPVIDVQNVISDIDAAKIRKDSETAIKNDEKINYFKTPDGQAYGFTYKGKIYVDPRIATAETPIHEYGHLWAEMKRQTAKEEWNHIKDVLLKDKLIEPIIEKVRREYPELEGKEDDFVEEVLTQFSGKHGAEKLRQMAEEIKQEMGNDAAAETIAEAAIRRVKSVLNEFWKGVADMMGWKYTSAEDIADRILSDMLNGVNPVEKMKEAPKDLKSQQEIERTLMGVHNLSEEKLRKALKVGGLANPSMAVVDTKQHMHTDYGDISLIPRASLIDARTGRNAGTFTADAWTPSYPQVVRRMTDKGQTKFWKDIRKLNEEAGEVASQMRMAFDTWLDKEAGQERLAYWYLSENGLKPELVLNENPYDKEVIKRLDELTDNGNKSVSSLPEEQIKEIADMYHAYKEKIGEPVTPAEERIKKLEARIDPNKQSPFTNLQKFRIEELQKYGELLHSLSDFVDRAGRASFYEGKPNVDATMRKAQEVVKSQNLQADFDKWLDQKAQDYGVEEWLFNGTDYQGRQKWLRNTLDNASKLMKKEGLNGAVGWSSLGSWIATVANKEKTLEGIRRNKKNLNTTEEEHDAWKEQWGEKLYPLVEKLGNGDVFHGDNILKDILEHKDFAGYYKREYGKELTQQEKDLVNTFINEVRTNFPTGYFETKFERPVGLDEFEIAVIPETTSPDIVEALKNAGLDVRTYDASDYDNKDANRTKVAMDAVSGRDDIRFQMVGRKGAAKADEADNDSERIRTLNVAKDATKAGIDPKAIKYATGWEQGKDGKWRYEIPDADVDVLGAYEKAKSRYDEERSKLLKEEVRLMDEYERLGNIIPKRLDERYSEEQKAKYRDLRKKREDIWERYLKTGEDAKSIVKDGVKAKLSDIIGDDNELFKYYPELKDMKVSFTGDMNTGTAGSYGEDGIELSANELRRFDDRSLNNENVYGTLLHEVQHAIQEIEGFAPGGNLYTSTTEEGINAIIDKKNRQRHEIQIKLNANRKILNNPEELKAAAELDRRSVQDEKVHIEEEVDRLAKEADDIFLQIERINHYKSPAMTDARDLYDRLAGEVESRNVTNRMNMSPEERRNSLATNTEDVPREDQVIIMGNGKSMNISDEAPKFQKTGGDIHSDNFKEFFGDWEKDPENASKVVDNKGKPLVVYHGTGDDFHIFDIEQLGKSSGNKGWFGEGFYFTPWEGHAKGYASQAAKKTGNDERVMPVYLNVRNPQVIDVSERENFKPEEGTDGVIVTIKFPKGSPFSKSAVKYDKDSYIYEIKVDNPNQIKSATENIGTYDPNNADIRYQRVSDPEPELTPEERQYWKKWDEDMKKWKEQNAIPAKAEEPGEKPQKSPDEDMMDYVLRLTQYNKDKAVWKTAPKLDDYLRQRSDKDALEAARENLERYPDSPLAKMRMAAAEFQQIRTAMGKQKAYDKATVKAVTDFAQEYMKMGFGDNLSRGEMERMLSAVKNATGAKDIRQQIDSIMNILTDNYLRNLDQQVQKLASVKELKQTAQGVEAQGKLELKGQRMIQAFREARQTRMTADEIRERMAEVSEYMARNDDEAPMWEQEYEGLSIALQYVENIDGSRSEYGALDREYRDAVKNYRESGRSYKAQQEYLDELDKAMMENKLERIGMFGDLINRLQGNIAESMQGAKEFVEREKQRIAHIQKIANYDLAGKDMGAMRERSKGKPANFFLQPLATFEQMLKQFGSRNANGEGYLYDYFMRTWIDSVDQAFVNEQRAKQELDDKAKEVFGDDVKRWSDLYKLIRNEEDFPGMDVEITDQGEDKEFHLNQGNLLYIYMANKMTDGAMKLRKMGITEEDVNAIKEHLDPRLVQLGDWLQDEYLVQKRTEYNKVHERMFGAPMAAIDHYFPIRILGDARVQEQDVANMADQDAVLPSTITGNIIKRRRNSLPLDILHTDALSLAIEHIEDMERWAATAEWNKDINTLLSYTTFRNKVKNMKTIYGSGDALWNTFADTARMAAGTYRPKAKPGSVDKTISNIAKGVTAAKISFRAYTAFKQTLSAPAFLHDVNLGYFIKNSVNPYGSWKWAMENMPVFNKRWKSRQVGDTRLMDDPTDWKMWKTDTVKLAAQLGMSPNALVDGITCAVGARSIYQSRVKKYKDMGMDEEKAEKRALQDAEVGYNLTQQSSEGAFVSAIQKDRTFAANALSVFRNSSMAYTRQWVDAARNLKHRMQPGYREDSIGFMAKQFEEILGLDEAKAQEAAEKEYARAARHDVARLLNFMFGVTVAWNLGASLPYLLIGDDDETKKEMLTDAFIRGMVAGPSEGFAAGNLISELVGRSIASEETRKTFKNEGIGAAVDVAFEQAGDYEINPLPFMADIQSFIKKMGYDKYAAGQDLFNIVMQSAVGVNPQTFTDIWNACMDYGNPSWMPFTDSSVGNNDLSNAKEIALFIMRLTNAPTSSWRNKYIDELGMGADEAKNLSYDEMARRYANYKHWKDAPVTGWFRSDDTRKAKMEKIVKQFDKAVQERMGRLKDEDVAKTFDNTNDLTERKMLGKEQAKRTDSEDAIAGGIKSVKNPEKRKAVERYVKQRTWQDLVDDLELAKAKRTMSADYKARREEAERRSMVDVKEFDKTEANIQTKQLLKDINKVEKDIKALRETIGTDNNDDERWQQIRSKRDEILNKIRAIQQK